MKEKSSGTNQQAPANIKTAGGETQQMRVLKINGWLSAF